MYGTYYFEIYTSHTFIFQIDVRLCNITSPKKVYATKLQKL